MLSYQDTYIRFLAAKHNVVDLSLESNHVYNIVMQLVQAMCIGASRSDTSLLFQSERSNFLGFFRF